MGVVHALLALAFGPAHLGSGAVTVALAARYARVRLAEVPLRAVAEADTLHAAARRLVADQPGVAFEVEPAGHLARASQAERLRACPGTLLVA